MGESATLDYLNFTLSAIASTTTLFVQVYGEYYSALEKREILSFVTI
jgi:hypothetical protein